MEKLIIIGNGFDLMHNLKTSYNDFKVYIENTYNLSDNKTYPIGFCPDCTIGNHGDEIYDYKEAVNYLYNLLFDANGYDWCHLEESFINLNFEDDQFDIDWESEKYMHDIYNNEDSSARIINFFKQNFHKQLLLEWFETMDFSGLHSKKIIEDIIDYDSAILNFNYTDTVEQLYRCDVNKMLHIHGKLTDGIESIVFGFDENKTYDVEESYYIGFDIGALDGTLKKNTSQIILDNNKFFESLKNVTEVYSIGFGYGICDYNYIKEIISIIDKTKTVWYIKSRDLKDGKNKRQILINLGFEGNIEILS